jgi:hypothetical protein
LLDRLNSFTCPDTFHNFSNKIDPTFVLFVPFVVLRRCRCGMAPPPATSRGRPVAPSSAAAPTVTKRGRDAENASQYTAAAPTKAATFTRVNSSASASVARVPLQNRAAVKAAAERAAAAFPSVCATCAAEATTLSDAVQAYEEMFDALRTAMLEAALRHSTPTESINAILKSARLDYDTLHTALEGADSVRDASVAR